MVKFKDKRQLCFKLLALAILVSSALPDDAHAQSKNENWRQALFAKHAPAILSVLPQIGNQRSNPVEPEGTGLAIDRFILTADHVLGNANRILVRDHMGNVSEAKIYLRDKTTDLALLEPTESFSSLELDKVSADRAIGSDVCVAGNAFGLGLSLTCGIVSASEQRGIGFNFIEDFIQIDAAVNPGMSGGPVFNDQAELIGLVTAIFTKQSDGNLGVNFAVSARLVKAFVEDAKDGKIDRAKAGMVMQNAPLAGETGRAGGLVKAVATGSVEEATGVKKGDLVLKANELMVKGQADYLAALALAGTNGQMNLEILRDGQLRTVQYSLENNSNN